MRRAAGSKNKTTERQNTATAARAARVTARAITRTIALTARTARKTKTTMRVKKISQATAATTAAAATTEAAAVTAAAAAAAATAARAARVTARATKTTKKTRTTKTVRTKTKRVTKKVTKRAALATKRAATAAKKAATAAKKAATAAKKAATAAKKAATAAKKAATVLGDGELPCYDQSTDYNCSHYSIRIAAEIILNRRFNSAEKKRFNRWRCPLEGAFFDAEIDDFQSQFPEMMVDFQRIPEKETKQHTRRHKTTWQYYITVENIEECLDMGYVCLLNLQRMNFSGSKLIEGPHDHCICCYGHTGDNFLIQDSNSVRLAGRQKTCTKTLSKKTLRENTNTLTQAMSDGSDPTTKLQQKLMHICEFYIVKPKV